MNHEITESFAQMVREKGLDKDILVGIIEDIFGMMVRKKYGPNTTFDVVVNMDKGDIEIYLEKQVVEVVEDPEIQISPEEAKRKSGEELEIGEEFVEIVPLQTFGRRLIISAKQNLNQRIKEIERETIYNEYSNSIGEIVVGEIYQIRKGRGEILVMHNKNELILPRSEQIFKERYKKGDTVRAVVKEVRKGAGNPLVIISRADPRFLMRLFEIEIPEIYDGIVEIKKIAREPGERAKVGVVSHDDRIDAVGACVGMKGVRIHAIVRELNNENIDVINFSEDPLVFIQRSLQPAKLKSVELDVEQKKAVVLVDSEQVSLAIGKNGQNVRLASKLTGFDIQLVKEGGEEEEEYDMDLSEFREELGDVMFHKFFDENFKTAKDVLETPKEELVQTLGIEAEKIDEIVELLKKGLEEAEVEEETGAASAASAAEAKDAAEAPSNDGTEKTDVATESAEPETEAKDAAEAPLEEALEETDVATESAVPETEAKDATEAPSEEALEETDVATESAVPEAEAKDATEAPPAEELETTEEADALGEQPSGNDAEPEPEPPKTKQPNDEHSA